MSGGKKNGGLRLGELGQFFEELGLIVFDRQEVVGLFDFDQVSGRGFLSVQGIGADEGAAQVQLSQELFEARDFIGFGRDLHLAADEVGLGVQSTEQLHGLTLDFGGGAGAFAIDGQGGDLEVLEMRTEPVGDDGIEGFWIQTLENTAQGGLAGGQIFLGAAAAGRAQRTELRLTEGLGEVTDAVEGVIAGNHGGGGDGDQGSDLAMAPAFTPARVGKLLQGDQEALGLLESQRVWAGMGWA